MKVLRSKIKELRREHPIAIVSPDDFVTEAASEIEPAKLLQDPSYSLYCFDPATEAAVFVEVDDPAEVESVPFYYQGQAEHAVAVVSMPLEVFHRMADQIPEPPLGTALIHSVGRCGSTLISKVLQAVPQVASLSEPDDLTQLTALRGTGQRDDEWIRRCLLNSVRWRCKPGSGDLVAIKTRAEVLALADLIGPSFPKSKHLFLYRDGLSWMRTIFRTWPPEADVFDVEQNREMQDRWSNLLPELRSMRPLNAVEIRMVAWVVAMEGYLELQRHQLDLRAVRYEDLVSSPQTILRKVFDFLGVKNVPWAEIEEVLGRDSQAGTIFGREERRNMTNELTPELEQVARNLVASRPSRLTTDIQLTGTIPPD